MVNFDIMVSNKKSKCQNCKRDIPAGKLRMRYWNGRIDAYKISKDLCLTCLEEIFKGKVNEYDNPSRRDVKLGMKS